MNVEDYRDIVHEDISLAVRANTSTPKEEFLLYATGVLVNGEEFDDFIVCEYEGYSRRNALMRIDGYSMDEMDGSCSVFIVDYRGPYEDNAIRAEQINTLFVRIYEIDACRS